MVEIIPALMSKDFSELREQLERFVGIVDTVQLDIMDGVFVPEKSWPYNETEDALKPFVEGKEEFPFSNDISHEVDLMVANPEKEVFRWMCVGTKRLIFHIESVDNIACKELIATVGSNNSYDIVGDDRSFVQRVELGVALNIETPNKNIEAVLPNVDFIQCMGIAKIGYQGQPFDERAIQKIKDLREVYPDVIISVDGGVNLETAPKLIEAGANRLVSGSAILKSDNVAETIEQFRNIS